MPIYEDAAQSCGLEFEALMRAQPVPEYPGCLDRFSDAVETFELGESLIDWLRK